MENFKFDIKVIKYYRKQGGDLVKTKAITIVLKDIISNQTFPHPLTHFIYKYYHRNSGSINTEMAVANVVVSFLNFVIKKNGQDQKFYYVNGISDITEEHANLFLQNCVEERANKRSTIEKKENYLSKFYKYLWDEGILKYKPSFKMVSIIRDSGVKTVYKLDFLYKKTDDSLIREKIKRKDIVPQSDETSEHRHTIRILYIREVLLIAKCEVPSIAFAIALQIFGGLRKGEVLNLTRTSLKPQNGYKYGERGLVVEIRDRQDLLFSRFSDTTKEQVKNPRDQACLIDPILCNLYKFHSDVVLKKIKNPSYANALFYDDDGNPMSGDTFDNRFLKLKNSYLGMLLGVTGRYQDYLDFSQTKWRSHIGRGIFTNMCLDAGFNEKQTAVLRGDKSTKSMESYFDIITATHNIRKALGLLSPEQTEKISNLNMPFYHKYWNDIERGTFNEF